jgi:acyl-CoA thioester hydrolase
MKPQAHHRSEYFDYSKVTVKLHDMDIYGHLNNNLHHQYFDNAVNRYLSFQGGLCMRTSPIIGLIVNSGCNYFKEMSWPEVEELDVGIRVNRLGNSSVQYAGALFIPQEEVAMAQGHLTHVWIDRTTRQPVPIPAQIRAAMEQILYTGEEI